MLRFWLILNFTLYLPLFLHLMEENKNHIKTEKMKRTIFYLSLSLLLIAGKTTAQEADSRQYIVQVGDTAPDFTLHFSEGDSIKLSDLRGKLVMLQFTASWCGVCIAEMPHIEKEIWQRHGDNPNFELYAISLRDKPEDVQCLVDRTGVTYRIGLDSEGEIFYSYAEKNAGVTRNIIIAPDGKIIMLTRLFDKEEFAQMVKLIDNVLLEMGE